MPNDSANTQLSLALSFEEAQRLEACETTIARGLNTFVEVGNALAEVRDGKLYRETYKTFEDYCRERWSLERRHAYRLMDAAAAVANVSLGTQIDPPQYEKHARPLTGLSPDAQIAAWQEAVETAPNGKVTAAHVAEVVERRNGAAPHVTHNSGENEWYTPPEYIEAARAVMGGIDTDPASSVVANQTVKAQTFYSVEDDGLAHSWLGRIWLNPPYSQPLIGLFCSALRWAIEAGQVTEAITLTNNATETAWFSDLLENAAVVCFVRGRIKFIDKNGNPSGAPLQGQAIMYSGPNVDRFEQHFSQFGKILYVRQ
jgi:phage N-6-adenine-methyltransferase